MQKPIHISVPCNTTFDKRNYSFLPALLEMILQTMKFPVKNFFSKCDQIRSLSKIKRKRFINYYKHENSNTGSIADTGLPGNY